MIELHEFFVEGGDQNRSHVLLHITEPTTSDEIERGYFFAVCEINAGSIEQIEHLQEMIDDLESGYYELEPKDDKDPFELTLEHINRRGHHILDNRNSIVNCIVGVLKENKVSLAYHGNPSANLIFSKKEELHDIDILATEEEADDEQLFSAVLEGELKDGDYLYVTTPHVIDFISVDRIKKIVASRTTRHSAAHVQKVLSNLKNELSYGGILFHSPTKSNRLIAKNPSPKIEATNVVEEEDDDYIEEKPTLKKTAPKYSIKKPKIETNYRPRHDMEEQSFFAITLITLGRALVAGSIGVYKLIKSIAIWLWQVLVSIILLITNRGGQRQIVLQSIENSIQRKKDFVTNLPLASKILFLITVLLGIGFLASVSISKISEAKIQAEAEYQNQIQAIVDKRDAAEASMIYEDESKAFNLLQEASQMIENLPDKSDEEISQKQKLAQSIEEKLQVLRKVKDVEAKLVFDIATKTENVNVSELAIIDNKLVAFGEGEQKLYLFDTDTNNFESKEYSSALKLAQASTPKEQDQIVFLSGKNQIAIFDKETGAVVAKDLDVSEDSEIGSLVVYNQRLYSVDKNNSQILKHSTTQTGFDRGSKWLKDTNIDLSQATSLAIDGDIFVLNEDGILNKFTKGRKENFDITGLDPTLTNPKQIWTYNDVNNLYILEPSQKRVVILAKDGRLIGQYTSTDWQNPTGMVVLEEKDLVYILDQNKIYSFDLE